MRIKKTIVIGAIMLGCVAVGFGAFYFAGNNDKEQKLPDVANELQQLIVHNSLQDSVFSIGGDIRITDSEDDSHVKEQSSFYVFKKDKQYYSQLSSQEIISDGVLSVQMDSVNKYMVVARAENIATESAKQILPVDEQMIDTANVKAAVTMKGIYREISYTNLLTPEIKVTHIIYDPATYKLKSAKIEWWKHPEMPGSTGLWITDITYNDNLSRHLDINAKMKSVLAFKNDQLVIAERFKTYKIHNAVLKN